ncbi:hypothetical protein L1049_018242 [Liquidambar formosana]|uniref:Uncharacterized protein n=1 Tax=Liquidambar formosana TaxID=63359 RepID=A0AAP0R9T3_LIQFO
MDRRGRVRTYAISPSPCDFWGPIPTTPCEAMRMASERAKIAQEELRQKLDDMSHKYRDTEDRLLVMRAQMAVVMTSLQLRFPNVVLPSEPLCTVEAPDNATSAPGTSTDPQVRSSLSSHPTTSHEDGRLVSVGGGLYGQCLVYRQLAKEFDDYSHKYKDVQDRLSEMEAHMARIMSSMQQLTSPNSGGGLSEASGTREAPDDAASAPGTLLGS